MESDPPAPSPWAARLCSPPPPPSPPCSCPWRPVRRPPPPPAGPRPGTSTSPTASTARSPASTGLPVAPSGRPCPPATRRGRWPPGPATACSSWRRAAAAALTHLAPGTGPDGAWAAQAVPLEAGATGAILAGDGRGGAAVVYRVDAASCRAALASPAALPAPPCQLACDRRRQRGGRGAPGPLPARGDGRRPGARRRPGRPHGVPQPLAHRSLGRRPGRCPVAGSSAPSTWPAAPWSRKSHLAGLPGPLLLAAGPGAAGQRLYGVEGFHSAGTTGGDAYAEADLADRWLVRGRDPLTLARRDHDRAPRPAAALWRSPTTATTATPSPGTPGRAGPGAPPAHPPRSSASTSAGAPRSPWGVSPGPATGASPSPATASTSRVPRATSSPWSTAAAGRRSPSVKTGRGPAGVIFAGG